MTVQFCKVVEVKGTKRSCFGICKAPGKTMCVLLLAVREIFTCSMFIYFPSQERDRRQQSDHFEGDILLGSSGFNPSMLSGHIADPNKMWPGGLVEYKFYKTLSM